MYVKVFLTIQFYIPHFNLLYTVLYIPFVVNSLTSCVYV